MTIPAFLSTLFFLFNDQSFLGMRQPSLDGNLAVHEMSLEDRYSNTSVNEVFKDNILLTTHYMKGDSIDPRRIDWKEVEKPLEYSFILKPGQTFAFHDDVLPEYKEKVAKTTNAHFNMQEGFKSDGYLAGDGVCHLASLLYWTAKDAALEVNAPTNHNFAKIPEIPKEFGVAIYNDASKNTINQLQNLYVTNNKLFPILISFDYNGKTLKVSAKEDKSTLTYLQ